jgi:hypothetical protein
LPIKYLIINVIQSPVSKRYNRLWKNKINISIAAFICRDIKADFIENIKVYWDWESNFG